MTHDPGALRALVHGRVQGVGFRYFVQGVAGPLQVTGYARNLDGGRTVEVVAEGERRSLDALLAELHRGPALSRVEKVDVSWTPSTGRYTSFAVR